MFDMSFEECMGITWSRGSEEHFMQKKWHLQRARGCGAMVCLRKWRKSMWLENREGKQEVWGMEWKKAEQEGATQWATTALSRAGIWSPGSGRNGEGWWKWQAGGSSDCSPCTEHRKLQNLTAVRVCSTTFSGLTNCPQTEEIKNRETG